MTRYAVNGATLECIRGDIADQPGIDAIVNAANARLQTGGGVAGAIHGAAGPGLAREGAAIAPIRPGQAVITGAHALPNRHVIHCLGPVYGSDEPADELLASCYRQALELAAGHGCRSLAFPAISTGAFGFPAEAAARIALETVVKALRADRPVEHVRFVLFADDDLELYERTLEELGVRPKAEPDRGE